MADNMEARTLFEGAGFLKNAVALNMGAPGSKHLKNAAELMGKATQHLMASEDGQSGIIMQYGPQLGTPRFRKSLAAFLTNSYGDTVHSENIMQTSGATNGLHIVTSLLFPTGTPIFIEDPTYFLAINVLKQDLGMNIVPIPTDEQGVIPEALDDMLIKYRAKVNYEVSEKRPFWSMFYTVTVFNNPTGQSLPPDRCHSLVQIARKHNILLFAEDVYNLINYQETHPPKRLITYDNVTDKDYQGHVISNGTVSKILSPGVRLGWIEASSRIISIMNSSCMLFSGGAVSHYASQVVTAAIDAGLQSSHLDMLCTDLAERTRSVCKLLREELSENVKFHEPKGGYFIWLQLPSGSKAQDIADYTLEKYNVRVLPGSCCSPTSSFENFIRISIAYYDLPVLEDAVMKLCKGIREKIP